MSLVVNKSLSTNPSAIPQDGVLTKHLGEGGDVNPLASTDLRVWYQEAQRVYNQAQQGVIPSTPEEMESLKQEMQKALAELSGGNYGTQSSNWDPMTQGAGATTATPPPGAKVGPNGNFIYDSTEVELGFPGQVDLPVHVYGRDITLNLDSTSVDVSIDKGTDTDVSPAEAVTILTVTNKATGETCKYYVHNEDKANIKINTPYGADQVTNNTGLEVEVGEYKAEDAGPKVSEGPAPSRELEGEENIYGTDEAFEYDGRGNAVMEFNPAAGVNQTHIVNGNPSINCLNSDQVDVSKTATGTEVVITHSDGSIDKFEVPNGYYININHALPQSIKWHDGTKKGSSGIGDLKSNAQGGIQLGGNGKVSANGVESDEDVSVVPENFADFITVNNEPNEEALPADVTAPQEVLDLANLCGIDDITKIPESLWNEIEHPTLPPSQALLTFLTNNYPDLKAAVSNPGVNSSDPSTQQLAWTSIKDSLLTALTQVYGSQVAGASADEQYADITGLDLQKTIFLGGLPFNMSPAAGYVKLTPGVSDVGETDGAGGVNESDNAAVNDLAASLGIDVKDIPPELVAFMEAGSTGKTIPVMTYKGEKVTLEQWLMKVDTSLQTLAGSVNSMTDSDGINAVYDHLLGTMQTIFQGANFTDARSTPGTSEDIGDLFFRRPDGSVGKFNFGAIWPKWKGHTSDSQASSIYGPEFNDVTSYLDRVDELLGGKLDDRLAKLSSDEKKEIADVFKRIEKTGSMLNIDNFWKVMVELDPELEDSLIALQSHQSDGNFMAVRDNVIDLLGALFPGTNPTTKGNSGGNVDDVLINGELWDVVDQDHKNGDELWDYLHWES